MALCDINIKKLYRTKQDDYVNMLISPALQESTRYDRGTGYFTLDSLAELASGLIPFIRNGGNIRVITSVELNEKDIDIIKAGLILQDDIIIKHIHERVIEQVSDDDVLIDLDLITNLIAAGRLSIKIAYMPDGIYHEKIGIIGDDCGNALYFSGSANATVSGLKRNWESVLVLTTWWGDDELIADQEEYFESLWNNDVDGIQIMDFPDAEKNMLLQTYKVSSDIDSAINRKNNKGKAAEKSNIKQMYPYQKIAVDQFAQNGYSHFFEMATGTGKTFTSVQAIKRAYAELGQLSVIILVPQIDLQTQWAAALLDEGISSGYIGGYANAAESDYNFNACLINCFDETSCNVLISTYDTFFNKYYGKCSALGRNKLIIVDEAHNLSPNQIKRLPKSFPYRLGLSATPERYNPNETQQIIDYFTRTRISPFKYTIDEAIEEGFLSHYLYYPLFVHFSPEDFETYRNYTKKLLYALNEDPVDHQKVKDILTKRSSVVKKSSSKLEKLGDMIGKYDFRNSVVYCGHGKDYQTEESIIDSVTRILAVDGKYSVSQFTSHTADRARVLKEFENENFDVLVAIKCFDEGVDVPKLDKIYIMASEALSRQTIQRRGRVLRKCRESGKTIAHIYDFIVLPPEGVYDGIGVRNLVKNEMVRAFEYARLADNDDVKITLSSISDEYGISAEDEEYEFTGESGIDFE